MKVRVRGSGLTASRGVVVRDYITFAIKLSIDGIKDIFLLQLASVAALADLLIGGEGRPRLFYRVVRLSDRFDRLLNLNGALETAEAASDAIPPGAR
ncbi:MAG: hypothetical protein RQ745_05660 [Longimicrobiales bacterium]|nr:hypothetical protein [Longimicrobiales bacterium]